MTTDPVFGQNSKQDEPVKTLTKRHAFVIATMIMTALLTVMIAFGIMGYSLLKYRFIRVAPALSEQVFEVKKGAGLSAIAKKLDQDDLISSARVFKIFVKLDGGETSLRAGEYTIPAQASMRDIYHILQSGQAILYPLTIAEGLTSAQIVALINAADGLSGNVADIPGEGTLLPETYMLPKTMSKADVLAQMQAAQRDVLDTLWGNRAPDLPIKTRREALILASIVEKETGVRAERERVAGVFINRLRRGMRLESDPTIIYGLTGGEPLGRGIRRSEIDRKTDWNTYQIDGLPKTAICNPGRAAIAAVLNPMATDDIFFVADGTGGHVFAKTLRQHNANVANWRKIERKRKAGQ